MDELVHHCLRELSFDGDLGSNVSRLRDFIVGFYASHGGLPQVVDDALCAFVWSVIVEQPVIHTSAKRKAAAKGEELAEGARPTLQLVHDARGKTLEDLKRQYGDDLRIAVDPETSFVAITGSHVKPPKLSPMVYTALQLITRGREEGITTVELGRKTRYDQKTCFYLIKQLVELGLVIKLRRGGVGNHTCIHRYFVESSPFWQQIQEEEAQDDEEVVITGENIPSDTLDQVGSPQAVFDPIDSRHLSSLPLVKNRIIKLLKASKNYMHASNNLLMTIGFLHPTKTDRRFFQTRLRDLIQQGVIERVLVPSGKVKDRHVKCIRLVTPDSQLPEGSVLDIDEDEKEVTLNEDETGGRTEVKTHLTIHKQVSNLLEGAGPSGLTLNEICNSLGNFDKRTIELLLTRASQSHPPFHISDLGTADLMETFGRERRHRYFTIAAYKTVMASEQLKGTTVPHVDIDLSRVGEFAESDSKLFYSGAKQLCAYQDSFREKAVTKGKKRERRNDDRQEANSEEEDEPYPKAKRGRPRKASVINDVQPLPKKRGRPRKHPLPEGADGQIAPAPKRGRPQGAKNTTKLRGNNDRIGRTNMVIESVASGSAHPPTDALSTSEGRTNAVPSDRESIQTTRSVNAVDAQPVIEANMPAVSISSTPAHNQPSAPADASAPSRNEIISFQGSQKSGGSSPLRQPDPVLCSQTDTGNGPNMMPSARRPSARKPKPARAYPNNQEYKPIDQPIGSRHSDSRGW
ncbi:hypothetical protein F5I97DRAFT_1606658 [Phlebopus sp. FC_14]|nr:hypothetical protein F5I97DRAFT_1606658 [Phlebopus sp. FC_14]